MSSHSHPASYRAAVLTKKGGPFEIVEVPWKDPKPNEVVVKTLANGVCHSDSTVVDQDVSSGHTRTPGHEIVGEVVAIGKEVTKWKLGMRVGSGWHGGHCFQCRSCRAGDFVTCYNENINGIISDGGYAEYVTLREEAVLSVPEDIDPAEASPMLCAGVTTFNALRHMDVHPGEIVAIQGIGGLGHLAIQFSRAMGFKTVALSNSGAKAALAKELGAHEYIDGSKVDQAEALQKMGGAKVVLVPVVTKRLSVRGWPSGTPLACEDTIKFAKENGIKCKIERYKLDQVNEAYQSMISGKARFRAVLVF